MSSPLGDQRTGSRGIATSSRSEHQRHSHPATSPSPGMASYVDDDSSRAMNPRAASFTPNPELSGASTPAPPRMPSSNHNWLFQPPPSSPDEIQAPAVRGPGAAWAGYGPVGPASEVSCGVNLIPSANKLIQPQHPTSTMNHLHMPVAQPLYQHASPWPPVFRFVVDDSGLACQED